jgi:hypothetical protein
MNLTSASDQKLLRRIRWLVALFIVGLVSSGATAISLESETGLLLRLAGINEQGGEPANPVTVWLSRVYGALREVNQRHPFIAYGGDWLAFSHFVIAIAFIGAWRDPVRNIWLFDFGLIACALVIPYALICGGVRGIPIWWRLIDCSFGIFGAIPLWICRRDAARLANHMDGAY